MKLKCLALSLLLTGACDDGKSIVETPVPQIPVAMVQLYDGYWSEETYFVRETDEGVHLSAPVAEIAAKNGLLPAGEHMSGFQLGLFSVRPDGTVRQYFSVESGLSGPQSGGRWNYVERGFVCGAGAKKDTVYIVAQDAALKKTCWLLEVEFSLVEATDERMVFDGQLNDAVRQLFGWLVGLDVIGIRTVWSKIRSEEEVEALKNATRYVILSRALAP